MIAPLLLLACSSSSLPVDSHTAGVSDTADTATDVEQVAGVDGPTDDDLFDLTVVHDVHLTLDPGDWLLVRDRPEEKIWVQADLSWGAHELDGIGLRAFGAGSLRAGKPSIKLGFDHFVDGLELLGLDELKLDNSSQDVGYLNEAVATAAMRRADVPASRTGWARLHVNGEPAGFFVLLESIDDRFVERWFGHDDGALYSMNAHNYAQGLNPMDYPLTWYEPETGHGGDGSELAAAALALESGQAAEIEALLDTAGFFRESVARSVMGSLDSFSADGNNFYLFDDAGLLRLIPWDFDVDLGGYYIETALTVDTRAPWVTSPWSWNPLSGAAYTDPVLLWNLDQGRDPDALVAELLAGPLDWATLDAEVLLAADVIRDDVHADLFGYGPQFEARVHSIRLFLHARWSILAGQDVADCSAADADVLRTADLAPTGSVGWGSLQVDHTNWGPGFQVAGEHYCTGLFAHGPSTVTLQIPAGKTTLTGQAGMQDWGRMPCGDGAIFRVLQGGETLWASDVIPEQAPAVDFGELQVQPGELLLQITEESGYGCDTSAWLDLELR
jgi:hypothetical protein